MTLEQLKEKVKNEIVNEAIISLNMESESELFNLFKERLNKDYHLVKRDISSKEKPNMDCVLKIVMDSVCTVFNVSTQDIISDKRKAPLPDARHAYVYICRELSDNQIPFKYVCSSINRDHATGIHGVKKLTGYMERDKTFRAKMDIMMGMCKKELTV